eukprot:CAMPEP_0198592166 /NCGR_PEP_ID=MMETSP1462-20131121/137784_1 /TAXON_ID=1333877 /ORGANISM="Brandtodinium nutriculum, Strain RCC3387" /LENGTH=146 /DNA_ID=CAMNT_0044323741 /DNA_START=27 /DNA_END=464 /DNA_ORIENTATION=+
MASDPLDVTADAEVAAGWLDEAREDEEDDALAQYLPDLNRYIIGHPQSLITKRKRKGGKGKKGRFFAEQKSEDVMADKSVTGCWACGRLDHESDECAFKRCFCCSQQGHELLKCTQRSVRCHRCYLQGHTADECPMVGYDEGMEHE